MKARILIGAAVAALSLATPAYQTADAREQLTEDEMDAARGGVLVAGGVAFEFGAVVKTFEDGVLRLQTQLTVTPNGPLVQQTVGQNVTQLTDQLMGQLGAAGVGDAQTLGKNAYVTDSGAVILQQLSQGQLVNLLVNTESNKSFRQDTDITITLPGFSAVQSDITRQLTGIRLANDLQTAQVGGY